jgi:tetratricopeptide (TPR) repeat protein
MTLPMDWQHSKPVASPAPSKLGSLLAQALALHQSAQWAEAERLYRIILADHPKHFDTLHLLGLVHYQRGEHDEAVRQIDLALTVNPNAAVAHNSRGAALKELGRLREAIASYDQAIALKPDYAEALNNRGLALTKLGRLEEAIASYDRAITLRPDFTEAFNNRGMALAECKRCDEALESYDRSIALRPDYAEAFSNRAAALNELGRFEDALASCDRAIALRANLAEAFYNRGNACYGLKRLDGAEASYGEAVALKPDYVEALYNRGTSLVDLKRIEAALADFDRAITLRSNYADAFWNRANARLLVGDYQGGWEDYEWRWGAEQAARSFQTPQWDGRADLAGKTILLHAEQGFGDSIMAARYLPRVVEAGARTILEVPAPLQALLAELPGVAQIVTSGQEPPPFDIHCPLMSLPRAFGTTLGTIPKTVPYLSVPKPYLKKWRQRLQDAPRPRIGISWAGRPTFKRDGDRSIGLPRMLPLLSQSGLYVFSLQKYLREGDADVLRDNPHIVQLGGSIEDFADTAAIMSLLDLVISSDTSTVHLAGALGVPVWILLHFVPDWRWLLDRNDSPWYPTARLFRQPRRDDWDSVVNDVGRELRAFRERLAADG